MIRSKRQFPDLPHFASLIEWKLPSIFRTRTKLARALTINDLAKIAKKKVPKVVFDYVEGSALDEVSYSRSKAAFDRVEFTAHTLRDVSKVDPSIEIFGKKVDLPILFSPTGYTRFMYHVGEPAVANVAAQNNLIYSLSTMVTIPPRIRLSTVFAIARKPIWWLNLFTTKKLEFAAFRGWNKSIVELAAAIFDPATKFEDVKWLQSVWSGPIIVKGVQNLEDAKRLAKMGVDGIILSNHGGRQLEKGPIPLELLPEVVRAVGKKVDIYIDGAVLSGQDAYAAVAMGAKAVFIGRAYLYGIMAGGERGVQRVVEIMKRDFVNTMALTGARNIAEVQKIGARIRPL